jgi:hypothetical protein
VRIEKLDATTIQFVAPRRFPLLAELLAGYTDMGGPSVHGRFGMGCFAPGTTCRGFIPNIGRKWMSSGQTRRWVLPIGRSI